MAAGVFSSTLPTARRYADLLATEGVLRGLIGPREVERLWERHPVNCALLGRVLDKELDVCDLGSGAGLPGLVLAIVRPDLRVTLVEPLLRRTIFLEEAVTALSLSNVEVVRARAEELHGKREFSVVTSRAVAPLGRLLTWSLPLVRPSGELVAMKGASAADEVDAAGDVLRRFGVDARVEEIAADGLDIPIRVVRVEGRGSARLGLAGHRSTGAGAKRSRRPRR